MNTIRAIVTSIMLFPMLAYGQADDSIATKGMSVKPFQEPVHRIEADALPGGILHTSEFLKGNNYEQRTMNHAFSMRLKYALMPAQGSTTAQVYKGAYQGIGLAVNSFNPQLGTPISVYLLQGARIASLSRRLKLNYEWNFGLSCGWHPYDPVNNPENLVIGSKVTAYIGLDFYLAYRLSNHFDINAGMSVAHYSNGNTEFPNSGLNTAHGRISLAYYPNRKTEHEGSEAYIPFKRYMSMDITLFGSWRRKGFYTETDAIALPGAYTVLGFGISPLYNVNHWLNVGASIDGVYDRSANLYAYMNGVGELDTGNDPTPAQQMALGLSGRVEFVMPFFTINMGIGHNIINAKGDFHGFYETLNLKIGVTKALFLNIGYCLNNFKTPNYLMLGLGVRINNKRTFR